MAAARSGFKMVKSVHSDKGTPYNEASKVKLIELRDGCKDGLPGWTTASMVLTFSETTGSRSRVGGNF